MGLFRLAVVVAVGVALLPADSEQQEMLYNRAALAARWTATFCDRNAETCTQAAGLWGQFLKKAEFGARLAYDMMQGRDNPDNTATGSLKAAPAKPSAAPGTLRPADLEPAWRGANSPKISVRPLEAKPGI